MTLGANPTFVCKDRSGSSFAVTIKVAGGGFDVKGCKKGYTIVIPDARRFGVKDGKQGFVEVAAAKVKVFAHR